MKFITSAVGTSVIVCAHLGNAFAAPDPISADSPTPPTQYKSPFKDYRPLGEDKRIPWKAANDEVGKIGGWRVYLHEAQDANIAASVAKPVVAPTTATPVTPENAPIESKQKPMHDHAGHGQPK
jgi:hypothetical protein